MRSEPYIKVECEKCDEWVEMELTALANGGWDDRGVNKRLNHYGWKTVDGEDFCEDCAAKHLPYESK